MGSDRAMSCSCQLVQDVLRLNLLKQVYQIDQQTGIKCFAVLYSDNDAGHVVLFSPLLDMPKIVI